MKEPRKPGKNVGLANLRPFTKGNRAAVGHGRPKLTKLTEATRALLAEIDPNDARGRTRAEVIADKQLQKAKRGDTKAFHEVRETAEGKAPQAIKFTDETPRDLRDVLKELPENTLRKVLKESLGDSHD